MADIRVLGTACESFAVDNNVYPWPAEPISDIAAVVELLEPVYVRVGLRRDPWGNPYLFWSNGQH